MIKKELNTIRIGSYEFDQTKKELSLNGDDVKLGSTELKLIELLIENRNTPISRDMLSKKMGGLNPRSVDVQIVRLRSKIEMDPKNPKLLKTIRNKGYVLYTG